MIFLCEFFPDFFFTKILHPDKLVDISMKGLDTRSSSQTIFALFDTLFWETAVKIAKMVIFWTPLAVHY